MSDFVRTTRANPCKVCGKHGWCTATTDGAVAKCMHIDEGSFKQAEDGSGLTYFHRLIDDDSWRDRPRAERKPRPALKVDRSLGKLASMASARISDQSVEQLGLELGLSPASLRRMSVGWITADQLAERGTKCKGRGCWSFPMRDAKDQVVGIRLRTTDGFKYAVKTGDDHMGSGIFIPRGLGESGKPVVIITEGPTDCAALLDMGFDAIGRPSNTAGTDLIKMLIIHQMHAYNWREAVILIDRDKPGSDASKNTWRGARTLAEALMSPRRSVRIIQPPKGINDARDWLKSGAGEDDLDAVIDAAKAMTVKPYEWMKRKESAA